MESFEENRAIDCQELLEELRRICCEETHGAQLQIDESSVQQERNPSTVSQLLTQIQDLQHKSTFLDRHKIFTVLRERAALERPTFPANL